MSDGIKYGLAGVIADDTAVSKVVPETNSLTYRGYAVQDLATQANFEETAYVIWHGDLPTRAQLDALEKQERSARGLSKNLHAVMAQYNKNAHPMDTVRTSVSFLGQEDPAADDSTPEGLYKKSVSMLAKIPEMVAADYRNKKGLPLIAPDRSLPFSENFFPHVFWKCASQGSDQVL